MTRLFVLVVEDDQQTQSFYRRFFEELYAGEFDWKLASSGKRALEVLDAHASQPVGVVILDLALSGSPSGIELLRRIKSHPATSDIPVFVVSGRRSLNDQVMGLEAGADDYLIKPVHPTQLWARLRVIFRRRGFGKIAEVLQVGDLRMDTGNLSLTVGGRSVPLEPKEFALLEALLRRPNVVHPTVDLWNSIWSYYSETAQHVLHSKVSSLRRKIGRKWGARIRSRRGQGYTLDLRSKSGR